MSIEITLLGVAVHQRKPILNLIFKRNLIFHMQNKKLLFKQYIYIIYLFTFNYILPLFSISKIPKKKFIIISRSRTGSTMLIQHLRKIPNTLILGEVLGRQKGFIFWKKFLKLFYGRHWYKISMVGFKFFYYHPVDNYKLNDFVINYLKKNGDIAIIHLIRRDLFATVLSKLIAEQTGKWSKKSNTKQEDINPFEINPVKFRKEITNTLLYFKEYESHFADRKNYIKVSYEDITAGNGFQQITKLLDVYDSKILKIDKSKKQQTSNLYKKVLNFKDLESIYEEEKNNCNYTGKP